MRLDERGEMPMEDLKHIFSIVDGCAVQYHCGTVMHSLAHLAKSRSVIYTRCIQAPSHKNAEVDGERGEIKGTDQRVYDWPALLPEDEKHMTTRLDNHKVEDGKIISLAKRMYKILTSSWRKILLAMNTHRKIKEQRIHLREFDDRVGSLSKMKTVGFAKGDGNKISSCYCFQADPDLGIKIAARRFFCNCSGCNQKLQLPVKVRYLGIGSECQY